jgi:hypothetical protein
MTPGTDDAATGGAYLRPGGNRSPRMRILSSAPLTGRGSGACCKAGQHAHVPGPEQIRLDWNREAIREPANPLCKATKSVLSHAEHAPG